MFTSLFRSLWALYRKDLVVWWGNRATIGASILPVVGFLIIQSIGVAAVGRNPVALVTLDSGPAGQQMRQILYNADVFRLTDATPEQAQGLLHDLKVAAIITIPADFSQRVQAQDPAPVAVVINNLNLDFTNDIRRAVPDAITEYYAAQGAAYQEAVRRALGVEAVFKVIQLREVEWRKLGEDLLLTARIGTPIS